MESQNLFAYFLLICTSFTNAGDEQSTSKNFPELPNSVHERLLTTGLFSDQLTSSSLVYLGKDGRLVYKPYTDNGDKILDFSYSGYKRNEEPIPNVAVVATVNPLQGETTPDGTMAYPKGPDNREQIQSAIDMVASLQPYENGFRGAVLLTKGTFYVQGSLLVRSGVVLRGEGDGPDGTVLIFRNPRGTGIQVGNPEAKPVSMGEPTNIKDTYIPAGSMHVNVEDASQFKQGDYIHVRKTTNDKWIKDLGMDRITEIRPDNKRVGNWSARSYQLDHVRQITQIEGNKITLDVQLPQSIMAEHGGGTVERISLDEIDSLSGVESLRILSNYDTAVKSVRDNIEYFSDEKNNLTSGIVLACINGWVRDCTVKHARNAAVKTIDPSRYCTVRDCKSLEPVAPILGGRRYPFSFNGGSHSLFYKCYTEDARHAFAAGSRVMGPNAFVQCTAWKSTTISEPHHRWSTGLLYDNITLKEGGSFGALNRGYSGSGHGWAGANIVFWNCNAEEVVVFDPPTPEQNFAIGYTGEIRDEYPTERLEYANDRSGYAGTPKAGVYKGFALMGTGYIENPEGPVAPQSLFIQQLIDRIGKKRAALVLKVDEQDISINESDNPETKEQAFADALSLPWNDVLTDDGTGDWTEKWFLDGDKAQVINNAEGMTMHAGPVPDEDASHAVLWTKRSFEGDIKVEYDYTRLDESFRGVNIIYLLATGSGEAPYSEDISEWNELRRVPTMSKYFGNMNTYHISYSTTDPANDYVRARRYIPEGKTLRGTNLEPDYNKTGLFLTGVTSHITVIRRGDWLFMEVDRPEQRRLFAWKTDTHPSISKGRVGFRQMFTRSSRYKNIRISLMDD